MGPHVVLKGYENETLELEIHSNCVENSWVLMQRLRDRCGKGNFKVEMRHNVYTVYIKKENVVDADKLQDDMKSLVLSRNKLENSLKIRPTERRNSEDVLSDTSEGDEQSHSLS